jgi:hypothetical protein
MSSAEISKKALELPAEERVEVARQLVESVVTPNTLTAAVTEGISRIEDICTGRVQGLSESEYRAALE